VCNNTSASEWPTAPKKPLLEGLNSNKGSIYVIEIYFLR